MVSQGAEEQIEDLIGIQMRQGTVLQHQGRGGAETDVLGRGLRKCLL
jgi:hypothetical protein